MSEKPFVLFRETATKDKEKRAVPLRPELAVELVALRPSDGAGLVFSRFPSDDALHADLRRAGIERKDEAGRVLHFDAFRKTFQSWGAASGVRQRSAQEMLGHSDPALTAGAYTDVAALELHEEVAKLPWVIEGQKNDALIDAQKSARIAAPPLFVRFWLTSSVLLKLLFPREKTKF